MPDDTTPNSSNGEQEFAEETETRPEQAGSQPDTTDGGGGEGEERTVPYSRFKQVNDAARHFQRELQRLDAERRASEKPAVSSEEYTDEQKAQIRAAMRVSDAEYREIVEERERQKREADAFEGELLDDTHDEIFKLAKAEGLPTKDESFMTVIGQSVMLVIRNDRKLLRQWNNGDLSCVEPAFDRMKKAWGPAKAGANGLRQGNVARIKRQVASLPTAPSGGSGTVTAPPPKSKDEKGITTKTHDRAWAQLQQHSE